MGSGRDKRKAAKEKKDGPAAGKGQEKTERKTQKNEVSVAVAVRHWGKYRGCVSIRGPLLALVGARTKGWGRGLGAAAAAAREMTTPGANTDQ
jgi:hypothetical protein